MGDQLFFSAHSGNATAGGLSPDQNMMSLPTPSLPQDALYRGIKIAMKEKYPPVMDGSP